MSFSADLLQLENKLWQLILRMAAFGPYVFQKDIGSIIQEHAETYVCALCLGHKSVLADLTGL